MKILTAIIAFCLITNLLSAQLLPAPDHLGVDLLYHTEKVSKNGFKTSVKIEDAVKLTSTYQFISIYNPNPSLSWQVAPGIKKINKIRVLVATSKKMLDKNKGDAWDTNIVTSIKNEIIYSGKPLKSGMIYYWKVQVWNDKNLASFFSSNNSFFYNSLNVDDPISHYPLIGEMQLPVSTIKKGDDTYFFDFGKDAFGQIVLHLTSNKNDSIYIEAGEALAKGTDILKNKASIRYISQSLYIEKGTHNYTITWPVNEKRNKRNPILMPNYIGEVFPFRYVTIRNYQGIVNPKTVERKMIYYPFNEKVSDFVSSDTVLNQVWDLSKYSMKATSFCGYYVDGDRERLPYEADALINQLSHYAVDAEYSIARRTMQYLIYHPTWPTEWSLQNTMLAWNDYLYTGDLSFIQKYYSELQKKIIIPLEGSNGLISTKTNLQTPEFLHSIHIEKDFDGKHGLKDIVDWPVRSNYIGTEKQYAGEADGFVFSNYNSVINAYYYHDLLLMQKIATVLHKTVDALFYETKAAHVYKSYQQIFRDSATGLIKDGDTTNHSSLHANMFALAFGLIRKADTKNVVQFIKSRRMACSVYGAQFLLESLFDSGQDAYAVDLLGSTSQRSWYNMIKAGSTITMEAWDTLYKPNLDLNHAWGAVPANIIVRKLMGVVPISPGGDTIQIKPMLGNLKFAKLTTTLATGTVFVSYQKNSMQDQVEIHIPGATVANIILPCHLKFTHVFMNGKLLSVQPNQEGYFELKNIESGNYSIVIK